MITFVVAALITLWGPFDSVTLSLLVHSFTQLLLCFPQINLVRGQFDAQYWFFEFDNTERGFYRGNWKAILSFPYVAVITLILVLVPALVKSNISVNPAPITDVNIDTMSRSTPCQKPLWCVPNKCVFFHCLHFFQAIVRHFLILPISSAQCVPV